MNISWADSLYYLDHFLPQVNRKVSLGQKHIQKLPLVGFKEKQENLVALSRLFQERNEQFQHLTYLQTSTE